MDLNTLSMLLIGFGCLFALVTLVYVLRLAFSRQAGEIGGWGLRGSPRTVFAVARTTVAEGIRAKVASGFALIIVVSLPFFYLTAEGDGTVKGAVQMFMAYSIGFTGFVLSLLTIFFSCRSLSNEIASRQIYGLVSKPVPRWQILAGKWLGVMALNVALLAYVGIGTYVGTLGILQRFTRELEHELATSGGLSPQQSADAAEALRHVRGIGKEGLASPIVAKMAQATGMSQQQVGDVLLKLPEPTRVDLRRSDELRRQVLVARAAVSPNIPRDQIKQVARKRYEQLKKENRLPRTLSEREIRAQIERELFGSYCTVPPMTKRTWRLQGPPPQERRDFIMSLRFKIQVAATVPAYQDPVTGATLEGDTLLCIWGVGDPQTSNYRETPNDTQPVRAFEEIEIPKNCIGEDGTIFVHFANLDPRRVDAVFDLPGSIEVLYRVGSFKGNVLKACLALLISLICLGSFGVCASTFLSFPVGSLIVVCLYLISISMGFIAESLAATDEYAPTDPTLAYEVRRLVVDVLGAALSIGDMNPTGQLVAGRTIDWSVPWNGSLREVLSAWPFALAKSGIVLMIGVLAFRRRELAAVIV